MGVHSGAEQACVLCCGTALLAFHFTCVFLCLYSLIFVLFDVAMYRFFFAFLVSFNRERKLPTPIVFFIYLYVARFISDSATGLALRDYLDDVNDVAGVSFADMDVSSKYDLESISNLHIS